VKGGIKTGNGIAYGGGSGGQSKLKGEYLRKNFSYIRDMIQKKIIYPALARRMGWEGKVTVSFIVVSDGRVRNIEIKEGSGRDILDKSAVETIRIASPFPAPPTEAQIIIPIFYKLI
jgi:protein TonB